MKFVLDHPERFGSHPAIRFADANVHTTGPYRTLPLYAPGFLPKHPEKFIIPAVDVSKLTVPPDADPDRAKSDP